MDPKNHVEQKKISTLLEGEGFNRILARESSVGQSSRLFYRHAEGVPFKWEVQPGTAKNPPEKDVIPPLSPPPVIQSLGLPLPQVVDEPEESSSKSLKIWHNWKKLMLKKTNQNNSSMFGDSDEDFAGNLGFSSSPSSSSSNCRVSESSRALRDSFDGPFCCSPWNITTILDEGNTKIYYCRQHKTAFALEEDGLILSRILSRVSSVEQSGPLTTTGITSSGVPFKWEMQPGTPKNPPENDVIPPPSPPPAVQSLALPRPMPQCTGGEEETKKAKWSTIWFWIKSKKMVKENEKVREISFRYDHKMEFDAFLRSCSSSSARKSWSLRLTKARRGCLSWISRKNRAILVYATRKLKH